MAIAVTVRIRVASASTDCCLSITLSLLYRAQPDDPHHYKEIDIRQIGNGEIDDPSCRKSTPAGDAQRIQIEHQRADQQELRLEGDVPHRHNNAGIASAKIAPVTAASA